MVDGAAAPEVIEPDWLREGRDRAKRLEYELPTAKRKGWEFTDLSELDLDAYSEAVARVEGLAVIDGAVVMPLAEAASKHPDLVRERLGQVVPASDIFTARNESRWRDGVFVHVPDGVALSEPLRLTITGADDEEIEWRALVVLGEGAEAELWERYQSEGDGLFNAVVELVVGEDANLRYV